jgi:hypothetical protein
MDRVVRDDKLTAIRTSGNFTKVFESTLGGLVQERGGNSDQKL